MKFLNIFAVAILIASTTCVKLPHAEGNMRNIELIEEDLMDALKNNNSPFASEIASLISVSLAEGQFDQIMRLLGEIWDDLIADKRAEVKMYGETKATLESEITSFFLAMNSAESARDQADRDYTNFAAQVVAMEVQIEQIQKDIDSVTEQITELDMQRQSDDLSFQARQSAAAASLSAVGVIIGDLQEIQQNHPDGNAVQPAALMEKIHALGDSNPIMALVEFSSAFDPETLQSVIVKMQALEAGMRASIQDDQEDEAAAIETYNMLRGTLQQQLVTFNNQMIEITKAMALVVVQRDEAQETYTLEAAKYVSARNSWNAKKAALVAEEARHVAAMEQIDNEIAVIESAHTILSTQLGYVEENMNDM